MNSSTAAAVTVITWWQRTLSHHNDWSIHCLLFFSFSHCPSELPSIVALPCPILSSSHCVCVKKLVSPLGQGAGMPGWKAPGENAFWTPLVLLVWCSASLSCWVSLSGTPGGPLLQTLPTTIFEPPTLLKIPSSSECCYPVLLGRENRGTECPQVSSVCDQRQLACHLLFSHIGADTQGEGWSDTSSDAVTELEQLEWQPRKDVGIVRFCTLSEPKLRVK